MKQYLERKLICEIFRMLGLLVKVAVPKFKREKFELMFPAEHEFEKNSCAE